MVFCNRSLNGLSPGLGMGMNQVKPEALTQEARTEWQGAAERYLQML